MAQATDREDPEWRPLLALVGERGAGAWMWMRELELASGERVQAYKNVDTRRHLYLAADGVVTRIDGCGGGRRLDAR